MAPPRPRSNLRIGLFTVAVLAVFGAVVAWRSHPANHIVVADPAFAKALDAPAPASLQPPDPCKLLTRADLEKLGDHLPIERPTSGLATWGDPARECDWNPIGSPTVMVLVRSAALERASIQWLADWGQPRPHHPLPQNLLARAGDLRPWLHKRGPTQATDDPSITYTDGLQSLVLQGIVRDYYLSIEIPGNWVGPIDAPVALFKSARQRLLTE